MKSLRAGIPAFALALAALMPNAAWAKEVAVAPFIAKGGLDPLIALNITSLVSSELDFSSEYEGAVQLEEKPAGLSVACLSQAACLKKIGTATGKEHLVAGSVAPSGDEYELYMVLFNTSGGSFVRKKSFKVATTPEKMADSMTGVVSELVTGKSVKAEAQEEAVTDDFDMFDDDFDDFSFEEDEQVNTTIALPGNSSASLDDFEEDPDDWEMEDRRREEEEARLRAEEDRRRAEEAERRRAEEEARRRAEEERRRAEDERRRREEEDRRRAEEAERRRLEEERRLAEDERRRREEEESRRRAEAERQADLDAEEDWDDISFGDATDEIEVEIDDIVFGDVTDEIVAEGDDDDYGYRDYDSYDRDSGSSSRSTRSRAGDDDDYGYGSTSERSSGRGSRDRDYDSLDGEDERSSSRSDRGSRSSSSRSGSSVTIDTGSNDPKLGVTGNLGYSRFKTFGFFNWGGSLKIPVADAAFIDVGLAGLSTQRDYSDIGVKAQEEWCSRDQTSAQCNKGTEWNSIANFALGLSYQNTSRDFRPYIGGDLTLTPYTTSFNTAVGLRARGGLDYMVTDHFGLNVNGTLGFWYGKKFWTVDPSLGNPNEATIALTPSGSVGTVILF